MSPREEQLPQRCALAAHAQFIEAEAMLEGQCFQHRAQDRFCTAGQPAQQSAALLFTGARTAQLQHTADFAQAWCSRATRLEYGHDSPVSCRWSREGGKLSGGDARERRRST